jgi:hypothetical protein
MTTDPHFEFAGGADAQVAAAIAAVFGHLIEAAATSAAQRPVRPGPSAWVQAGRPRPVPPPLPSHAYHATGWMAATDGDDAE